MTRRLLVLSDLHISPPGPLATFHQGPALAALLQANAHPSTTLVLAGDIVDLLQVDPRPSTLDMPGAPALLRRALTEISATSWGHDLLAALTTLLDTGGHLVILPGNHDPELFHPHTRDVFLEALHLPADHPGLTVHAVDAPWTTLVGSLPVRVVHGHRLDGWNDIDPEAVLRAVETGAAGVALPPGSRLVLEIMNPLKKALDRTTGERRFPFLDLLKPERATVSLLLPYLDWDAAAGRVPTFAGLVARRFLRRFERALRRGRVLAAAVAEEPAETLDEVLADALAETLPEDERSPDAAVRTLQSMLVRRGPAAPGTLAVHEGAIRRTARWYLERVAGDTSFFDRAHASDEDRAAIARELPEGSGPRVAVFGHTHAARDIDLGDGRHYLNCGTWMDLMKLPDLANDAEVQAFIDRLEAGDVPRLQLRTYVEVTEEGAALRDWPAAGSLAD